MECAHTLQSFIAPAALRRQSFIMNKAELCYQMVNVGKTRTINNAFRKLRYGVILLCLLTFKTGFAQTKTSQALQQVWLGYFNNSRINSKWGFVFDMHVRTGDHFLNNYSQAILRGGISYYINDRTRLTFGDTYSVYFSADDRNMVSEKEHRPWQQLQWQKVYAALRTTQALRIEERFRRKVMPGAGLHNVTNFNLRFRYNFSLQVPLAKVKFRKGSFSFVVTDEINFNAGEQIVYNWFDQNRFFAGFNYHVTKDDNLQLGYMNVQQHSGTEPAFRTRHVARVYFIHNIDYRKNK